MKKLMSRTGVSIAFDKTGEGLAVILVGGALQTRVGNARLATLLEPYFTIFNYDRRGRGDSDDVKQYAAEDEIEDIKALIDEAGGSAYVFGSSSGANLSLEAARKLNITKLILWEPNFVVGDSRPPLPADYVEQINKMVASHRRGEAIEYFMKKAVGLPAEFVTPLRNTPFWPSLEAAAHTLAYDGTIVRENMAGKPVQVEEWSSITVPTLVLDGGTTPWLSEGAEAIANALPNAKRQTLEGQTHDVAPEALAPALVEFFKG